jgi:hypothetical protein
MEISEIKNKLDYLYKKYYNKEHNKLIYNYNNIHIIDTYLYYLSKIPYYSHGYRYNNLMKIVNSCYNSHYNYHTLELALSIEDYKFLTIVNRDILIKSIKDKHNIVSLGKVSIMRSNRFSIKLTEKVYNIIKNKIIQ